VRGCAARSPSNLMRPIMRIKHLMSAVAALLALSADATRAQQTEIVVYHYQTDKR
jgi:hypothetical protein